MFKSESVKVYILILGQGVCVLSEMDKIWRCITYDDSSIEIRERTNIHQYLRLIVH